MSGEDKPTRQEIADLLAEAAELEHSISLQYLFAAFSLKTRIEEGGVSYAQLVQMQLWKGVVLSAARQEMEHLGLVCNILSAIGEAPSLWRRNFPVSADVLPIDIPLHLSAFGLDMLRSAILYELPSQLERPALLEFLDRHIPAWRERSEHTIGRLYEKLDALLARAGDDLFIGPPDAQISNLEVFPARIVGVPTAGIATRAYYSVLVRPVYTVAQARAVIDQIRHEGEGFPGKQIFRGSHFYEFVKLFVALDAELKADPAFAPARPVVPNPRPLSANPKYGVGPLHAGEGEPTWLTSPLANELATLFDRGYQVTVLMLMRFYFHQGQNAQEIDTLSKVAFFPMMTTFIRPLGEVLMGLRAFADPALAAFRAGPAFTFAPRLAVIPDPLAAWRILRDEILALRAGLERIANSGDPELSEFAVKRLTFIWQNLARIAIYFDRLITPPQKLFPPIPPPPPKPAPVKPQPLLVLQYSGWVLIRLPTDPDPTDAPRGASGFTFAFGDEPDLTRCIAFDVPANYRPRSHTPPIGVYVQSAQRLDEQGARDVTALQGARFRLLDDPRLENRNWTLTMPGCEPIVPFKMQITGDGVSLLATDELTSGPLWEASNAELQRRGPPGFSLEPETAASVTGQWNSLRIVWERLEALKQEYDALKSQGGPAGELAVLKGRITQLEYAVQDPSSRPVSARAMVERFGFVFNQPGIVTGDGSLLGRPVTAANTWGINFWLGAWDADLMVAYMKGSLTIPYEPEGA